MENPWEPIWFEGGSLPHPNDIILVDESGEVDESGRVGGSGTINESEIAESEQTDFGESKEISEN